MELVLKNEDTKPIYQQIIDHVKKMIATGELAIGAKLPSIRQLAKELQVSVITTKRAYEELQRVNFIDTVPSKGSFVVARDLDQVREEYLKKIAVHMRKIMFLSEFCGLTEEELALMYHLLRVKDGKVI
ncbi:MAG TPA: GntR family transcriptional regulator [Sphaerochaeta sp.]|nr:GntR family transcriptional regulator [Sphaerochaeta sp.]